MMGAVSLPSCALLIVSPCSGSSAHFGLLNGIRSTVRVVVLVGEVLGVGAVRPSSILWASLRPCVASVASPCPLQPLSPLVVSVTLCAVLVALCVVIVLGVVVVLKPLAAVGGVFWRGLGSNRLWR